MPRQRIINPEFWLDEQIASCVFPARLLYIGIWNFSDDYGVIEDSVMKLKAQIFPYDDMDVAPHRLVLIDLGKLIPFEADGKAWLYIKNFLKYQRVEKPSKFRNPVPPTDILGVESGNPTLPFTSEEKGSEVKRNKAKRSEENTRQKLSFKNLGELQEYIRTNTIYPELIEKYPDRDYEFQIKKMSNWWLETYGKYPDKPMSALTNWLERTTADPDLVEKRVQQNKRELEVDAKKKAEQEKPVNPETLDKLREKMKGIGKKI